MGSESADTRQQKFREFMSLLPLTVEVAGLARAEPGKYYNEGQMENRAAVLKTAYKIARQLALELSR